MSQRIERQTKSQDSKTLTRHWDNFGRTVGYSVDGERKQSITYDSATGRIAESDGFRWDYLAGSNLKSSLTYPNEDVVMWTYEPYRDLLTAVTNATYSTYVYTNDLLGRRTSKNDEQYGYNGRDELISADDVSYAYDDIGIYAPTSVSEVGNRTTAEGKTYTANNLNQYTAIDDFVPQYDADGNQTLIKTETGIWSVVYNAENRPFRWQSGDTVITMAFDRMGRRIEMRTVKDGEETLQRFVYDNYLCIQQLRGADNALFHSYVWDPTEPIATRPLVFLPASDDVAYYFHDGNKNVSDLVGAQGGVIHYAYTIFGLLTEVSDLKTSSLVTVNPFRFSSEFYDSMLSLIYYNYRHFLTDVGRFLTRDPVDEYAFLHSISPKVVYYRSPYVFAYNSATFVVDILGLLECTSSPCERACEGARYGAPLVNVVMEVRCKEKCRETFSKFQNWMNNNRDLSWTKDLPACPCSIGCKGAGDNVGDGWLDLTDSLHGYHLGAKVCMRSSRQANGAANQCCYDGEGALITHGEGAGSADRVSTGLFSYFGEQGHQGQDVFPADWAKECDGGIFGACSQRYLDFRPALNKNNCQRNP